MRWTFECRQRLLRGKQCTEAPSKHCPQERGELGIDGPLRSRVVRRQRLTWSYRVQTSKWAQCDGYPSLHQTRLWRRFKCFVRMWLRTGRDSEISAALSLAGQSRSVFFCLFWEYTTLGSWES